MDWDLLEMSGGAHKCASCTYCPTAGDTTTDPHSCWFFYETWVQVIDNPALCMDGQTGNCRTYSAGIETADNGGGYWVIRCAMYKPEAFDYNTYCGTRHWQETRRKALQRAGYKCEICGTGKNLNVHHITYEHVWDERPEDLLVCCRSCHTNIHWSDRERTRRALPMFNRIKAEIRGTEADGT